MAYVIATKPGRVVRRAKNNVQKFAQVRADRKFKFVTDPNLATVFPSMSAALQALQVRGAKLRYGPTQDLTVAEVTRSGLTVSRFHNGG